MATEKIRVGIIGASVRPGISGFPTLLPTLAFNVAQLYKRMAEGFGKGKSVSPDFDLAVKRHELLDVIQKASDTGIRQVLSGD